MNWFWLEIMLIFGFIMLSNFQPNLWLMVVGLLTIVAIRWLKLRFTKAL